MSAGLDDDGGTRRARIDGERTDQSSNDAAGPDAGKVPADIVRLAFLRRKGARHRRGLHDADHGDDEGKWHKMADLASPRQRRKGRARHLNGQWQTHAIDAVEL